MTTIILAILGIMLSGALWLVWNVLGRNVADGDADAVATYARRRSRFAPHARQRHVLIAPARATRDA